MARITLTLTDTPAGGVAVQHDFKPAVGQRITPAQGHALEIINRTHQQWGTPIADEDFDGVHTDTVRRQEVQMTESVTVLGARITV